MPGFDELENSGFLGSERDAGMSGRQLLEHYLLVLLHRKWLVMAIFLVVSAGSAVVAYRLPDVYTAETLVLIDPQQVAERYIESTVTSDISIRLGALSQQILSAPRLQEIIDQFNLYAAERQEQPPEAIIELMRSHITLTDNLTPQPGQRPGQIRQEPLTFGISYDGDDPETVAQVTNELAALFVAENLKSREKIATDTSQFIESQLEETRQELKEHETKISEFRSMFFGELPDQQPANLQLLNQMERQLEGVNDALERAAGQKTYLLTLLEENQAIAANLLEGPSQEEILLPELQARYSDQHPDVQRYKRIIEEQQRAREAAQAQALAEAAGKNLAESIPTNRTLAPVVQLKTVDDEIVRRTNEQARLEKDIALYRARVEMGPVRERQLADLMRDYDIAKDYYSQLLQKKLSAATGTDLELRQMGEQFSILNPAKVPESPSGPNRRAFIALGLVAGMVLGALLALASEILGFGVTITSPEQIATLSGVALLGAVSVLRTQREQRLLKWKLAAIVLALLGAVLFYQFQVGSF
jgi:polysaccharide chain length determinant protein (PEP-CTERM system associated)